jgi:hypothetical protein
VGWACGANGGEELVTGRQPEGKRPLGRPRRKWVDNIKMDLAEIGLGGVDRIGVV